MFHNLPISQLQEEDIKAKISIVFIDAAIFASRSLRRCNPEQVLRIFLSQHLSEDVSTPGELKLRGKNTAN